MNIYSILIVILILVGYGLDILVDWLNVRAIRTDIPDSFKDWYDSQKYKTSQQYLKDNTTFDMLSSTVSTGLLLMFIFVGGFNWIDQWVRSFEWGVIGTGLLFGGILVILSQLVSLPFSIYSTFVLEEKYGFNRTKPKTFIGDLIKGLLITGLLGAPIFAAILWFFSAAGPFAWLYSWLAVILFQFVIIYLAPIYIMPLFNKFTPLEEGELNEAIKTYAKKEGFHLQGIFKMDGSKRSAKSNAYFTGFGRMRRIVLFDTLIDKHSVKELVAVLAHEVGHYKKKHIQKHLISSIIASGVMFFLLSIFITQPDLYAAFQVSYDPVQGDPPIYAGMIFFGFLYSPISFLLSIFENRLSRKHEFEADLFAVETTGYKAEFIDALKKLTVDNLGNLRPHPLKVFLSYSHPPVLARIDAIRSL